MMLFNRLCFLILAAPTAVAGFIYNTAGKPRFRIPLSVASESHTSPSVDEYKIPVTDGDPRFPSMLSGFNQRWIAKNAKAVYMVRTPDEVATAMDDILDTYKDGLKIRSGGHCYENFVMNEGTNGIIDVGNLQDWGHNEEKGYYLSTGENNWSAFKKIFQAWGFILPSGSCYSVGLGGHISGGGDGILSRLHGTTCDWVTGIEIVVKDNSDKPAYVKYIGDDSEGDDADLFWACKGAGNGNFGVITKYYFKELPSAPMGTIVTVFAFKWGDAFDAPTLKKILDEYVDFAGSNNNRASSAKFPIMHEAAGESQMTIHTFYHDDESKRTAKEYHSEIEKKLKQLYPISNPSVTLSSHGGHWSRGEVSEKHHTFTIFDAIQNMSGSGNNQRGKYKSAYMKQHFPLEQCEAIIKNLKRVPEGLTMADMKDSCVQIDTFGGRINDFSPKDTALAQRSYKVKLQFQNHWADEKKDEFHLGWIRDFYHKDMYGKYGGIPDPSAPGGEQMFEGCYYNYPDVDLNDYGLDKAMTLYFGVNYEEADRNLIDVKRRWDPTNFFNHAQSIPVRDA